ncbi:DUF2726 domain-containing protein, partial [Salmonella enterica]|nr:DUF2726 domain-containing protein [Salmonella enterica]ECX6012038.1 DUF2726 domain-containing protein [Salmonella enterica subsp. enterica serovar Rubislaw]EEF9470478.1 DUF2726 domain-containing protein [Salmonella enterica]EEJ9527381.1 DUF2726 domain-containing protein [Salmonella enterica subsp. enterica serovar Rubislaw]EKY9814951.1 DUF2726 domain-containing protein [Salmonella enterica]
MIFLIIVFVIALVILIFTITMKNRSKKNTAIELLEDGGYEAKPFMTEREREFYSRLNAVIPKEDHLMSQVRLVDIVSVNPKFNSDRRKKMTLFRKISQWHCDYIWVDKKFSIKFVIELDDSTHRRKNRVARDVFFNAVIDQVGYEFIRLETKEDIDKFIIEV